MTIQDFYNCDESVSADLRNEEWGYNKQKYKQNTVSNEEDEVKDTENK